VFLRSAVFVIASGLSLLTFNSYYGARGLEGAAVGAGIALVIFLANHLLLRWSRGAEGPRVVAAMTGSILLSLGLMLAAVLLLANYWKEILHPAALTALFVYLACRFLDAYQANIALSRKGIALSRKVPGAPLKSPASGSCGPSGGQGSRT